MKLCNCMTMSVTSLVVLKTPLFLVVCGFWGVPWLLPWEHMCAGLLLIFGMAAEVWRG